MAATLAGTTTGALSKHACAILAILALVMLPFHALAASAQTVTIAVATATSGGGEFYGNPFIDGVRLATEEAAKQGSGPSVEMKIYDDHSTDDGAKQSAAEIAATDAWVVVGPTLTTSAIAAGAAYTKAGLAAIAPIATGYAVTHDATTYRPVFGAGDVGGFLASYIKFGVERSRAVILYRDNGYGRPVAEGFRRETGRLAIPAIFLPFNTAEERDAAIKLAVAEGDDPAIVLGLLGADAASVLTALRRQGSKAPVFGTNGIADPTFAQIFAKEPEEQTTPGLFTEGVYVASPMLLDSANAETQAFADRFQARFGHAPSWVSTQSYDAARVALAAIRTVSAGGGETSVSARRASVLKFLAALDGPGHAVSGLSGPIWFDPEHGRSVAIRIGRFHAGELESAPIQLVPLSRPDRNDIASGALHEISQGHYARRQQVVYTGIYLNEVPRLDIAPSTFTADFYFWLRFVPAERVTGIGDPTDLSFPDLVRGSFDAKQVVAQRNLDDGTIYKLWRMRGDFKNDFDLHHYPMDRQTLFIRLFNAKAASDRLVYVQDRRSLEPAAVLAAPVPASNAGSANASETQPEAASTFDPFNAASAPDAFRNLTQWRPVQVHQRRDNLVTRSALGDPLLVGLERARELSGFNLTIDLQRYLLATLAKTLLPLGMMSLIMFASQFFPHGLVKEKITVAITAALSGAVLLASVNSQLGAIGYTMAVEYVFYIYFTLCVVCIVSVLFAERLRVAGRGALALNTELAARTLFGLTVVVVAAAGWIVSRNW